MNDWLLFQLFNQQQWCVEAFQENWSKAVLLLEEGQIEGVCMPQKGRQHANTHTCAHTHTHAHARAWFAHINTSLFTLLYQLATRAMNFIITKGCVSRSCCSMEWVHKRHASTFHYIWHLSRYWHTDPICMWQHLRKGTTWIFFLFTMPFTAIR